MAEFIEKIRLKFVELTESFTVDCELENDTDYHVDVDRHDGKFKLPPRGSIGQWLYKGFSISLLINFPNGQCERIEFPWSRYQDKTHYISDVFREQIEEYEKRHPGGKVPKKFEAGMKLEASNRQRPSLICVATITEVKNSHLQIHLDGWPTDYDYWCEPTTSDIHPVGWCESQGVELQKPYGCFGPFNWSIYLANTSSIGAPSNLFSEAKPLWSPRLIDFSGRALISPLYWIKDRADKMQNIRKLKQLMNDPENTIEVQFLKLYFIGPSGIGKTTTRLRLTHEITNLSLEQPERCSTHLAECVQCFAVVRVNEYGTPKLSFKTSKSIDEESHLLYAYAKSRGRRSAPSESRAPVHDELSDDETLATNEEQQLVALRTLSKMTPSDVKKEISNFHDTVGSGDYETLEHRFGQLLLNLVDIGGQPGFLEMLPFLSKGPGMFLAFFPLWKELSDLYEVSYEREEDRITPYKAKYTIYETLSQILSSIDHYVGFNLSPLPEELDRLKSIKPVVTLVGTFKDKLELQTKAEVLQIRERLSKDFPEISRDKLETEVKLAIDQLSSNREIANVSALQARIHHYLNTESSYEVEKRLNKKLQEKMADINTMTQNFGDLVMSGDKQFFSVDNVSDKDPDLEPLRDHLKHVFEKFLSNTTFRIHPNQLFFGIVLRKLFVTVPLYDCFQFGRELNMTKKDVRFTLWYLSECVGALIYHPEVNDEWFRQYIICNSQVIFDSISSLIVKPLLAIHSDSKIFYKNEVEGWKHKGQFSLDMIKRCHTEENREKLGKGELIPVKSLVKFLEHSNILAPIISKDSKGAKKVMYFIPAILDCAARDTLLKPPPTDVDTPYPVKITFERKYVPIGLFCAIVSRLVSRGRDEEGILGMKWKLTKSGVKRNLVCFLVDSAEHIVTLISRVHCLEIRLIRSRQVTPIPLHDLCSYVLSTVLFIMKEINRQISPIIAFDCKCSPHNEQSNKLCCLSEGVSPSFKCECGNVSLATDQKCWISKEVRLDQSVSLKALPYFDSPDPKLTFKWRSKCNDNELRLETVVPDDCNTYYTCKIYKDGEYFFSVHHYLEAIGPDVIESGPPLFEKVKGATKGIRSQWYSLAVQLGISHSIRQIIREKHYFVEPCFHSMIQHWVSRTSPPPTKAALIEAVESPVIDHKNLVAKISRIPDSEFQRSTFVYPEVKSEEQIHVHRGLDCVLTVDSDLKTVRELTWEIRTKWSNFGLQLGITKDDIEAIESDNRTCGACLTAVLEQWLIRINPEPPTPNVLIDALKSRVVDREIIAHKIEEVYSSQTCT